MSVENLTATGIISDPPQNGIKRSKKHIPVTVEVSAAASVSSTYTLAYVPSGARLGDSRLYWDDMATSGAPTLDIGLSGPSFTYDDDKLNDGLDLATANATTGTKIVKDIANQYKPLWLLAGLTSDPDEIWTIKAVIRDAAVTAGGTLSGEINFSED
jgi:hypothetical protein